MSSLPQQLGWLVMPVEPPSPEPEPEEPSPDLAKAYRELEARERAEREQADRDRTDHEHLEGLYGSQGWRSCLYCRAIYRDDEYGIEHGCSPPSPSRPARAANLVRTSAIDDGASHIFSVSYGHRMACGFLSMSGSTDDRIIQNRWRNDCPPHSPANEACHESPEQAAYWRRWREHNTFIVTAPKVGADGLSPGGCVSRLPTLRAWELLSVRPSPI